MATAPQAITDIAIDLDIEVSQGVYAGVAGPSFETPAEVGMLQRLGADLVGMSTVLEVIAARHMGMECLCLSMVSNHAAGIGAGDLDHSEVLETGRAVAVKVQQLLDALLSEWLSA